MGGIYKGPSVCITVVFTIIIWLSLDPLYLISSTALHLMSLLKEHRAFFQAVEFGSWSILQAAPLPCWTQICSDRLGGEQFPRFRLQPWPLICHLISTVCCPDRPAPVPLHIQFNSLKWVAKTYFYVFYVYIYKILYLISLTLWLFMDLILLVDILNTLQQ